MEKFRHNYNLSSLTKLLPLDNMLKEWTEPGFQYKCFDIPQRTTTARKTEEKMVADRNRPVGLMLEWKKIMMMMLTTMRRTRPVS
jgi:hypothetical protein